MNNKFIVSILIPCYNVDKFLPRCINSIINQTYRNLQIVLIDDGSEDNTWMLMQNYAAKDNRIEIYHQENQGVASTRNNLLDKVKGDYVLFVDSDDWCELDMVDFLINKAITNKADVVTCSMVKNDEPFVSNISLEEIWDQEKAVLEFLRHKIFNGSLWNKLIKTSLLHNLRFHCGIFYGEDALFIWNVLQKVNQVLITDRELYHYRVNDTSLSHQNWTPFKKGSGHKVWSEIVSDTEKYWIQFLEIAKARFAIEDMWGLYYASLCDYPYDEHINERQMNIRHNLKLIKKSGLLSNGKLLAAYVLAYCYCLGKIFKFL